MSTLAVVFRTFYLQGLFEDIACALRELFDSFCVGVVHIIIHVYVINTIV